MNTIFYLIRHGEVDNPLNIVYGRTDVSLSTKGRRQMQSLAETLKKLGAAPDVIISSTLNRAIQSTQEIQNAFPNVPVSYTEDLQETDCGKLTGEPMQRSIAIGDIYHADECKDMGIEKPEEIIKRMRKEILDTREAYPGKTVFMISHGDPLAFLLRNLLDPNEAIPSKPALEAGQYLKKGEAWKMVLDEQNRVCELETISNKKGSIGKEKEL